MAITSKFLRSQEKRSPGQSSSFAALPGPAYRVDRFHLASHFWDRRTERPLLPVHHTRTVCGPDGMVVGPATKRAARLLYSPSVRRIRPITMKYRLEVFALGASVESYARLRNQQTPPS